MFGGTEWEPPSYNVIATMADVYNTRLLVHETIISMVPTDFGQRQISMDVDNWIDGCWEQLEYFKVRKAMGIDALCYGKGFLKWMESYRGDPEVIAVPPDELLFANYDDPDPHEYIHRVWADREDVLDRYGTNEEARAAIMKCPAAFPAFFFGPGSLDTQNVIPLVYGLRSAHADKEKTPGREVLCIGNYTIYDKPWEDADTNLIGYDFHEVPSGLFGQGIPELLLSMQEDLDRRMAVEQESDIRSGTGKWFYDAAGDIDDQKLGDTVAATISVAPGAKYPEYVTPLPINEQSLKGQDRLIDMCMKRVHVSANAVQGEVPKQLTSAVALDSWAKIDDVNFAENIGRLEEVDRKSAYQTIRLGKKLKTSYTRTGTTRQIIKWSDLKIDKGTIVGLKALNVGKFGQTYAAKQQTLQAELAAGNITRDEYNKYLQVPNTQQLLDQLNAPETGVDTAIDKLVLSDEYIPPSSFLNLDYAKQAVEARYIIEQERGTPDDQLDFLLQWRAAVIELKAQQSTPDAAGFGPAQLPGVAPGAPVGTSASIPGKPIPIPATTTAAPVIPPQGPIQ
jgi:hypothetical protein